MAVIIYDRRSEEREFIIDEVSQQIIVYLGFHGSAQSRTIADSIGVDSVIDVKERVEKKLGRSDAGLVEKFDDDQMTLDGTEMPPLYRLTEAGNSFVYKHKSVLKTPTELESIVHTVSNLKRRVDQVGEIHIQQDELHDEINRIEDRIEELEDRLQSLE